MTETNAENWAIFEEAMFMLQDVPGETLLERVARLSKWYLDMQMELGSVKHKLEVSEAVNRLTAPAQARPSPTAEDIYAYCQSTLIGFRDELTEQQIKFICDQIARKSALPSTSRDTPSEPRLAERLADVVIMLDAPDAYNREYIAAVCRSILSSLTSTKCRYPNCDLINCDCEQSQAERSGGAQ